VAFWDFQVYSASRIAHEEPADFNAVKFPAVIEVRVVSVVSAPCNVERRSAACLPRRSIDLLEAWVCQELSADFYAPKPGSIM
jgi:hypothetical protein